ncbi:MAG: tRNA pseudouridine(55) synthase TruB [Planctomycetota bacterium]
MPHGALVIDKPPGLSSARALAPLKRLAGRRCKVGHAGTLDPFATGVLLALVGDATRVSDLAMALPKTYHATICFGRETDTLDPEGAVVAEVDPGAAPEDLAEVAARFVGEIEQVPPAFSALKVAGRRAYRLARSGERAALAPRKVKVFALDVERVAWPEVEVAVGCGAGCYVRALARDLGAAVGLPAHLTALRRTHVGPFAAADGVPPDEVAWDRVRGTEQILAAAGLAWTRLERAEARAFAAGRTVRVAGLQPADGPRGVRTESLLVGLGVCERAGHLRPRTVFADARHALESLR